MLVFITYYFQEKLTSQNVFKNPKTLFWAHSVPFNFPGKKGSVSFSIFERPTIVPKIRKKPNESFLKKLLEEHTKNQFISLISL